MNASPHSPELSVVVIAFNEEACLQLVVRELLGCLQAADIDAECVLVDDGSRDRTLEIMRAMAAEFSRIRVVSLGVNGGIGAALRAGFDAAQGAYLTWIPADGQIGPEVVVTLFRRRLEAAMLTTVYRARADHWIRHVISKTLNTIIRIRTGHVAKSGGNYLFSRAAWERHSPRDDDSMMISTAFRHALLAGGERIVEVEIDARARVAGESKVLNARSIWRTLAATLRMVRRD
jgi:glycosyltransferase involved in cell wall biosynthesis